MGDPTGPAVDTDDHQPADETKAALVSETVESVDYNGDGDFLVEGIMLFHFDWERPPGEPAPRIRNRPHRSSRWRPRRYRSQRLWDPGLPVPTP